MNKGYFYIEPVEEINVKVECNDCGYPLECDLKRVRTENVLCVAPCQQCLEGVEQ